MAYPTRYIVMGVAQIIGVCCSAGMGRGGGVVICQSGSGFRRKEGKRDRTKGHNVGKKL